MIFQSFKPSPLIQEYVDHYLLLHYNFKGSAVSPVKLYYPHAEQCLTFNPKGSVTSVNIQTGNTQYRAYSYLSQQQTTSYKLHFDEDYLMLKVVFKPGALYRLLGIPLSALEHQYVDAELVIPGDVKAVNEQLLNAQSYLQMISVIDQYLTRKIATVKFDKHPIDKIDQFINSQDSNFSLSRIAGQVCLSNRQLERKFMERIGVGPQAYYRITRFNKAFIMKESQPGLTWFNIAIDCGYVDLQHLIKDFKQFSGTTPTSLLYEEANAVHRKLNINLNMSLLYT